MMADCPELRDLVGILRNNGDKILDATSKLTLSAALICKINSSFQQFVCCSKQRTNAASNNYSKFQVLDASAAYMKGVLDLQFLHDFVQKTVALKILPEPFLVTCSSTTTITEPHTINLDIFKNLKLLELNRISLQLVKGLKYLRSQLEYLTCVHTLSNLNDILESCGADKTQGFVWNHLRKAVFTHNYLSTIDASLEFIPKVEILDLSHNNISDANSINCLTNLTHLNLSFNKLQFLPPFCGSLCHNLRVLQLHNNFIESIKELSVLFNLELLDLNNNCIIQHRDLIPLRSLPNLVCLKLKGNPLSLHAKYRPLTINYLYGASINLNRFTLDGRKLNKKEQTNLIFDADGQFESTNNSLALDLERSYSMNSEETLNTVISKHQDFKYSGNSKILTVVDVSSIKNEQVSVGSVSVESKSSSLSSSSLSNEEDAIVDDKIVNVNCVNEEDDNDDNNKLVEDQTVEDELQMQDSGFFAGPKPLSPSQSSIGSASSLFRNNEGSTTVIHNESDIEVLTNPSQSSIEVLDYKIST